MGVTVTSSKTSGPGTLIPATDATDANGVANFSSTSATAITLSCEDYVEGTTTTQDCTNPTNGDNTIVFTATVTNAAAPNAPRAGIKVNMALTETTAGPAATSSATFCTTAADGTCSVTVTNPTPADGDVVEIDATVAGDPGVTDNKTKTWETRAATTLDLTPEAAFNEFGTAHTVTSPDETSSRDDPETPDQGQQETNGEAVSVVVESESGLAVSVYLADESMADAPLEVLADCAQSYLEDFATVSCFGFASEEALVAAQVDDEKGGMKYLCWSAFYNLTSDGSGRRSLDNAEYDTEHCPA